MNIIYMLTNVDKKEGRRFYIGSKTECFIEEFEGLSRIVSSKTGKFYYGSSTCLEMKADMKNHHRFSAVVLEEVPNKKDLLERENEWIRKYDAVNSSEFYNKSYAILGIFKVDQQAPYNEFGETILGYGKLMSSFNKKNNTAKKFGFKNLGEFCVWIYQRRQAGLSWPAIADEIGWERHQPQRYVCCYNMEKSVAEYDPVNTEVQRKVRVLIAKGASVSKTAELLSLEIPTVIQYIDDFNLINDRTFLCAQRRGMTKEELGIEVTKRILDGAGFNEVSVELNLNETSVKRYFLRCVRANLKSSDL